ncbi:MAG: PASTA domain-containing protein [Actinobacteria bacterium]|nr:PASTA domain-containing protein [Actinomycetota bacterium]
MSVPRDPVEPDDETVVDPDWQPGPEGTRVIVGDEYVEEEIVEEEVVPRRLPTIWPWLLALLLLVIGGLAAIFFLSRDDDDPAGTTATTATVPVLVGLREDAARDRVREAGLEAEVQRRTGNKAAGVVLAQRPEAGTTIAEGSEVLLTVSSGAAQAAVPDLVGEQRADAIAALEEAGFRSRETTAFSEQPEGEILEQDPAAGEKLAPNGVVALTISKGQEPEPVVIPDVVGSQGSEAAATLREAGLSPNVVTVPSNRPGGEVVAQAPAAGSEVDEGTAVRLNVSAGATQTQPTQTQPPATTQTTPPEPAPAVVPDVVGGPLADAARAFGDQGLKVSVQPVPSEEPAGNVVAQARPAGTELERGDTVQLNISTGPEPAANATVPEVVDRQQADARSRLASAGFEVLSIQLRGNPSQVGVVISQTPDGNAQIPGGSLVILYVGAR